MSRSVTVRRPKGLYLLQIETKVRGKDGLSQSVTVRPYFAEQLLQIETNQSSLPKDLDL